MPLYAQHPALRARQVAADLGMLAWIVLWVLVARTVHRAVLVLAEPGRAVEDLGSSVAGNMETEGDAEAFNIEMGYAWTLSGGLKIEPQLQYTKTSVNNIDTLVMR